MTITNPDYNGFRWVRGFLVETSQPPRIDRHVATGYQAQVNGTYNVDLNIGDPVAQVNDGSVGLCAGSEGTPGIPLGVICGIAPYWNGQEMVFGAFLPGATAWGTNQSRKSVVQLIPAHQQVFEIDANNEGSNDTVAEYESLIGNNADHVLTAAAAQSNCEPKLDLTSVGTDTEQWRVVELSGTANNRAIAQTDVKLLVTLNEGATAFPAFGGTGL